MNYKFPEHLMTKEYIQKQINIMDKILSRAENPRNITDAELKISLLQEHQFHMVLDIISQQHMVFHMDLLVVSFHKHF